MNFAIIVAGGKGKRFSSSVKKQFYQLDQETVLEKTISVFNSHPLISFIIVVITRDELHRADTIKSKFNKVTHIIEGGEERRDSVFKGLTAVADKFDEDSKILIHDGVRPFVSHQLITKVLEALDTNDAVIPGITVEATLKKVDAANFVTGSVDRSKYFLIQTPQGFKRDIYKMYAQIINTRETFTDDAMVLEYFNKRVKVIEGEKSNIKITTIEDIQQPTFIGQESHTMNCNFVIGIGIDVHKFKKGRKLFLGGVEIDYEIGLDGHSDADVLIHSVIDALLGASGNGDIGEIFPDNDPQYKDISSILLLKRVYQRYIEGNYNISNIDLSLVCEEPKLKKYKPEIKRNLSDVLNISINQVNIKATTTEKLGFTGRQEGIMCYSVCLLCRK